MIKLRRVNIRNFRLIETLAVELNDSTVIIGENNAGKSAFLDAIRLALSRASARKGCAATEYDFNLSDARLEPQTANPIEIELLFKEDTAGDWSDELTQELNEIVQLDPHSGLNQIHLRYTAVYNKAQKAFEQEIVFLNIEGRPLKERSARYAAFNDFLNYVPVFYLSALRDVGEQFSPRSPFWGRLLRSVEIPEDKRDEISQKLEELNAELLSVDPKLDAVTKNLAQISEVVAHYTNQEVSVRALPLRPWDLMSRSEVVLQGQGNATKFPLSRHGQGVQSLAVLFLLQSFISEMLPTLYSENADAILELEEPEAHLHPQAARALWIQIQNMDGQTIVTTHSPFFVQNVPFRDVRILRREGSNTRVFSMPERYTATVTPNEALRDFVTKHSPKFSLHSNELSVAGSLSDKEYRDLLKCYIQPNERHMHATLRGLLERSQAYISPDDLLKLETYVRRMRGEILFARCWLLCEGQTEYILLHQFSMILNQQLDANAVAVIDYQNNGSPGAFASCARVLGFKWVMFSDGDAAGKGFIQELKNYHFTDDQIAAAVKTFPAADIEALVATSTLAADCRACLTEHNVNVFPDGAPGASENLAHELRSKKPDWASWLAGHLADRDADDTVVPDFFKEIIASAVKLAHE